MMKFAIKKSNFLYKGSPVCHDYGFNHFYYVNCVMNCAFDCEYCFLKGKYSDNKIVVYKNLDDYFDAVENLLNTIPASENLYLCVSFDTDLFALEDKIHYVEKWSQFAATHDKLICEVRTKANLENSDVLDRVVNSNMVFAFSLTPQKYIDEFEKGTANLSQRINSVNAAMQHDANVRLCLDPIVYRRGWQQNYKQLIDKIATHINFESVQDISVGTFRIPPDYLKNMRKKYPSSVMAQFPYSLVDGFYQYPEYLRIEVENYVVDKLQEVVPKSKIFVWK